MADRDALMDRIRQARKGLQSHFAEEGKSHPLLDLNLTMSQLKVVIVLSRHRGASAQELAGRVGASPATFSGIVDRLVAQGLVARREDPDDRRVRRLDLTAEGKDLIDRVTAAGNESQDHMLQRLDDRELAVVAEAFELILRATAQPQDQQP